MASFKSYYLLYIHSLDTAVKLEEVALPITGLYNKRETRLTTQFIYMYKVEYVR